MAFPLQKFREIVLQMLFSYDLGVSSESDLISMIMSEVSVSKKVAQEALLKVLQILEKQHDIDERIAKASTSYAFERIQNVEKNVLRLGVYELLYEPAVPSKVAISEAIRISRKFSSPESANFINAVLDAISKTIHETPEKAKP
jgi:N utilization substance protein B